MDTSVLAVVTACFDRWEHLRQALPTWRTLPGAPPIFVGTYEDDPVPDWVDGVHLVRVPNEPLHLTRLRNCIATAARLVSGPDYLLFLDADIQVEEPRVFHAPLAAAGEAPDFVLDSAWALSEELLLMSPRDPERDDPGKRGTHLVRTELFFGVGGYDQRLVGWGVEDRNLYGRYRELSDRVAYYDRDGIRHIPHPDALRARHNPGKVARVTSMLSNLRRHMESRDVLGATWRDELGYPGYTVSWLAEGLGRPAVVGQEADVATAVPARMERSAST